MCSLGSSEHLGCGFQVSVCGVELLGEAGTFSMKAFGVGKVLIVMEILCQWHSSQCSRHYVMLLPLAISKG